MKLLILCALIAVALAVPVPEAPKAEEKAADAAEPAKEEEAKEEAAAEEPKAMYLDDTPEVAKAKEEFQKIFELHEKGLHGILAPQVAFAGLPYAGLGYAGYAGYGGLGYAGYAAPYNGYSSWPYVNGNYWGANYGLGYSAPVYGGLY